MTRTITNAFSFLVLAIPTLTAIAGQQTSSHQLAGSRNPQPVSYSISDSTIENCLNSNSFRQEFEGGEQTFYTGLDGSKQPQDFGANAHLGLQTHLAFSGPLFPSLGIGYQAGGGITAAANAVQVFELLGENSGRVQAFSSIGLFRRNDSGFSWGGVWDYQYQESFDDFSLNQVRLAAWQTVGPSNQAGITVMLPLSGASGEFNSIRVQLDPLAQVRFNWRRFWSTGTQTTLWAGVAEGHREDNVLTGPGKRVDEAFLFGSDILAPISQTVAIYGEANLMMPPDTGGVDAFLGLQFFRNGGVVSSRQRRWSPLLPVASNTTFTADLDR